MIMMRVFYIFSTNTQFLLTCVRTMESDFYVYFVLFTFCFHPLFGISLGISWVLFIREKRVSRLCFSILGNGKGDRHLSVLSRRCGWSYLCITFGFFLLPLPTESLAWEVGLRLFVPVFGLGFFILRSWMCDAFRGRLCSFTMCTLVSTSI